MKIRATLLSRLSLAEPPKIFLEGTTENIGKRGVAVVCNRVLPAYTVLRCELIPPGASMGVPTLAEVRWCIQGPGKRASRLGLQFLL